MEPLNEELKTAHEEFHEVGSPYFGLSLSSQKLLAKWRRGNKKAPKAFTRLTYKAREEDYSKIFLHCIHELIHQSEHNVEIRMDRIRVKLELIFNYRSHFGKGFPRPSRILYYKDWSIGLEFHVDGLLKYLYDIGYSAFTGKELRRQLWAVKAEADRYDFLMDYAADISIAEFYNDVIPNAPMRKDKALKGRRTYRKSGLRSKKILDTVAESSMIEQSTEQEDVCGT